MTTFYILSYKTIDNFIEKRAPYREEHLQLLQDANDDVVMAGALAEPADGAVLIFRNRKAAEAFAKNDPYVKNNLITEWHIRPWSVVIGENV